MAEGVAWCPRCGDQLGGRFPLCGRDGSPTPLYVEVNAVAQYLVGVPTYVEFRLTNVSDTPVTVDEFRATLSGHETGPGVLPGPEGRVVSPREAQPLIVDRRIVFREDEAEPGAHLARITVAFRTPDAAYRMSGEFKVVLDRPGSRVIHVYDPLAEAVCSLDNADFPGGIAVRGIAFGEQNDTEPELAFNRQLKETSGFRFIPVRMSYQGEPVVKSQTERVGPSAAGPPVTPGEAKAYCPHCWPTRALAAPSPQCPHCEKDVHLYVDINHVPFYLESVKTKIEFRLYNAAPKTVSVNGFRAFLGDVELPKGMQQLWRPELPPGVTVPVDRLLNPSEHGETVLMFEVSYEIDGVSHLLKGAHDITVLPLDATRQDIVTHLNISGHNVVFDDLNIPDKGFEQKSGPAEQFLREIQQKRGADFHPLELHLVGTTAAAADSTSAGEPTDRATLWFDHKGVTHNYCLLSMQPVIFGRKRDAVQVRLFEVEECHERVKHMVAAGLKPKTDSVISRQQWEFAADREQLRVRVLSQTNPTWLAGTEKQLKSDQELRIARGEGIEIRGRLGLKFAAAARSVDGLDASFSAARAQLDRLSPRPPSEPRWDGPVGAYTLRRLHSLTGEASPERTPWPGLEAYVLLPAWASIGASNDACIVVPEKNVAPLHAVLFYRDGYYFVRPFNANTSVTIDWRAVQPESPRMLRPGNIIRLGDALLNFCAFRQLYIDDDERGSRDT